MRLVTLLPLAFALFSLPQHALTRVLRPSAPGVALVPSDAPEVGASANISYTPTHELGLQGAAHHRAARVLRWSTRHNLTSNVAHVSDQEWDNLVSQGCNLMWAMLTPDKDARY
jgi:hypothetical protein